MAIAAGRRLSDRLFGGAEDAKADYTNVPVSCTSCYFDSCQKIGTPLDMTESYFVVRLPRVIYGRRMSIFEISELKLTTLQKSCCMSS